MKKNRIYLTCLIMICLMITLVACSSPSIYIEVKTDADYSAVWYNNDPIPNTSLSQAYLISYKNERVAILKEFEATSESGPTLNQTKGSKEQTLKFTLITNFETDTQPSITLKVNDVLLSPKKVEKRQVYYNNETKEQWCFDYQKDGFIDEKSVVLSFEGLVVE